MNQEIGEDGWQGFFRLCLKIKDPKQLQEFFDFFLTKEEVEMLSSRYWVAISLLKGELTQREIAKEYKVSIAQITRGSNALKSISPELKTFLQKNIKHEEEEV
jgi:TrpR family trp operon transcriptional repressor